MKKILTLVAVVAAFASCGQKPTAPTSAKGEVIDASMNNIMLVTANNDTIALSTMALQDSGRMIGVLLGDSIKVDFATIEGEQAANYFSATSIELTYRPAQYFIPGAWVEPNPIKAGEVQGIQFNADGTASSINMATLLFEKWSYADGKLSLTATSVGNRKKAIVETVYDVTKLTADSMVLSENGRSIWSFGSQK